MKYVRFVSGLIAVAGLLATVIVNHAAETLEQSRWFLQASALLAAVSFLNAVLFGGCRISLVDCLVVAFAGYVVFGYFHSGSVMPARLAVFLLLVSGYFGLRIVFASGKAIIPCAILLLLAAGVYEAFLGFSQLYGFRSSNHHIFRITGTFFNPGPYGGYLAVVLSVAVGYAAANYTDCAKRLGQLKSIKEIDQPLVLFICSVVATIALLLVLPATMSRAAWLALLAAVAVACLIELPVFGRLKQIIRKNKKQALIVGGSGVLILALLLIGVYFMKKDSADGRLLMWKISAGAMADHPVLGVGMGYFPGAYADKQAEYFSVPRSQTETLVAGCPEYGFNEYLQMGVEFGLAGLLLFLSIAGLVLWNLIKSGGYRRYFAYGLIALLAFAFFSYPFSLLPFLILSVMFFAAGGGAPALSGPRWGRMFFIVAAVASVVLNIFIQRGQKSFFEAHREYRTVRMFYNMEHYQQAEEGYKELYPAMRGSYKYLFEYGHALNKLGRYRESNRLLEQGVRLSSDPMFHNIMGNNYKALGQPDRAEACYLRAHRIVPGRMYPLYLLAKLYAETGQRDKGLEMARRVLETAPKVPSPATRDMQDEMEALLNSDQKE